jgi:hypothetical protein
MLNRINKREYSSWISCKVPIVPLESWLEFLHEEQKRKEKTEKENLLTVFI